MTTTRARTRWPHDPRAVDLVAANALTVEELGQLQREDPKAFAAIETANTRLLLQDAKVNQLIYYRPANPDAIAVHLSTAREIAICGGNRSTKTDTMLVEMAIQLTGIVPMSLAGRYPAVKLREGGIRARLVVSSLVTAWDVNLKPKLQWWQWNGKLHDGVPGDCDLGHWGWIPQRFLINGDWNQSWSEKHRVLTLRHPTLGWTSTLQVMSHDQDPQDFAQGAYHIIGEDELPPEHVHRENKMRVVDYGGQVITGGTPPDDRTGAITAAWFHDGLYVPGSEGSDPDVFAVTLWTERNRTLSAEDVAWIVKGLTPEEQEARLHGKFLHLSGLILPGFTPKPKTWCFTCHGAILPQGDACPTCHGTDLARYSHIWDEADLAWPGPEVWPLLFYMDPHQSRPTACHWVRVDPNDGWWIIAEKEIAGDAAAVKAEVERFEREELQKRPVWRKGDPKITAQTNQFAREFNGRSFTIREAFAEVGFFFDEANTNFTVGRERILDAFKPSPYTRTPRLRIHASCTRTIYQIGHFVWDAGARRENVNAKEQPSRNHSDFPALLRYLAMDDPTYRQCEIARDPRPIFAHAGARRGITGW